MILQEVDAKRHQENEAIRAAAEEFIRWSGWMLHHPDHPFGDASRRIKNLREAYVRATGLEIETYT